MSFEKLLQDQCQYWQGILRLRDWDILVQVCRQNEMTNPSAIGECEIQRQRKDATIRVLAPQDLQLVSQGFHHGEESDYDLTLVHELLHIHLDSLGPRDQVTDQEEQVIEAISQALVRLRREALVPLESPHASPTPSTASPPLSQPTPPIEPSPPQARSGFYI
jgi:hypothetical protein